MLIPQFTQTTKMIQVVVEKSTASALETQIQGKSEESKVIVMSQPTLSLPGQIHEADNEMHTHACAPMKVDSNLVH